MQTYRGIDACGQRLVEEIQECVSKHPNLDRLSIFGHSMGGLIARYALGDPHSPSLPTVTTVACCFKFTDLDYVQGWPLLSQSCCRQAV